MTESATILRTKKDVESLLDTTLRKFKEKLDENAKTKGCFWCDDSNGEGLQNKCEGLQAFVYRFEDSPEDLSNYFDLDKFKKEVLSVCDIIEKNGFIATPYLYEDLKKIKLDPPEFIDVPSYALTLLMGSREVLKRAKKLSEEEDEKILNIINKSLDWFIKYHISEGGWTGLPTKSYTSVYATWSAVESLLYFLDSCDDSYPEEIIAKKETIKDILSDVKNWILNFAKNQKAKWVSDDSDYSDQHGVNTVYGIAILSDLLGSKLLNVGASKDELELLVKILRHFLELWRSFQPDLTTTATHYFFAFSSKKKNLEQKIRYEDDSILLVATMTLSDLISSFSDKLKTWEGSDESTDVDFNVVASVLLDIVNKMIEKYYRNGLWVDDPEKETFSIYVTERAIEALDAYADALDVIFRESPEKLVESVAEKVEGVIESLEQLSKKLDDVMTNLDKFEAIESKLENLESELQKISNKISEVGDISKAMEIFINHKNFKNILTNAITGVLEETLPNTLKKIVEEKDEQSRLLSELKNSANKKSGESKK